MSCWGKLNTYDDIPSFFFTELYIDPIIPCVERKLILDIKKVNTKKRACNNRLLQ